MILYDKSCMCFVMLFFLSIFFLFAYSWETSRIDQSELIYIDPFLRNIFLKMFLPLTLLICLLLQDILLFTRKNKDITVQTTPLDKSTRMESTTKLSPSVDPATSSVLTPVKHILSARKRYPPAKYANLTSYYFDQFISFVFYSFFLLSLSPIRKPLQIQIGRNLC